jgi:hypothetical protein
VDQVRQTAQLQEQLMAELTLDKTMLPDKLSRKW